LSAKSCWRSLALAALVALPPARLAAQRGFDLQVQGLGLAGAATFLGAGAGAGLRAGLGSRLSLAASGGWLEDAGGAARMEALFTYHLFTPGRPRPAPYAGAGVGVTASDGGATGQLVVVLGLETGAQRGAGWFVEAGVGGGVRVALGYRLTRWRGRRRRRRRTRERAPVPPAPAPPASGRQLLAPTASLRITGWQ
jgi:hypothetical protein